MANPYHKWGLTPRCKQPASTRLGQTICPQPLVVPRKRDSQTPHGSCVVCRTSSKSLGLPQTWIFAVGRRALLKPQPDLFRLDMTRGVLCPMLRGQPVDLLSTFIVIGAVEKLDQKGRTPLAYINETRGRRPTLRTMVHEFIWI